LRNAPPGLGRRQLEDEGVARRVDDAREATRVLGQHRALADLEANRLANHGIALAVYMRPTPTSYACRTMNSTRALPCFLRWYVDRIASPRSAAASPYSSSTATPMTTRPYC
jgi:hypothetical protein